MTHKPTHEIVYVNADEGKSQKIGFLWGATLPYDALHVPLPHEYIYLINNKQNPQTCLGQKNRNSTTYYTSTPKVQTVLHSTSHLHVNLIPGALVSPFVWPASPATFIAW